MATFSPDTRYPPPPHNWVPGQPSDRNAPPLPPRPTDLIQSGPPLSSNPPPVPSTPRPPLTRTPLSVATPLLYPTRDEVFTLPELVEKHQSLFPLKVVVVKGHYGDRGEESAIATHELYNIHFIKRSRVFTVKDDVGYEYIVPLNTACKFGIYYEKDTCYFDTIEDVMKASPLPKVIAAQTAYCGNSPKNSVHRLEVLVIKGVNKGRLRKPTLSVFSVSRKEEKQLSKDVFGRFTTDPSYTYMYLTDLVKYVPYKFPLDVHLYPEFDGDAPSSNYLVSERMTIVNEFVETCIVTTPMLEEVSNGSSSYVEINEQIVDIPLTLPIEVSVLPPEEDEADDYEQLYEATRTLISGYDPMKSKTYRDAADDYSYTTQTHVFSAVRKGFESEGLNIEMPKTISSSKVQSSHTQKQPQRPPPVPERDHYEDMDKLDRHSTGSGYEDFDITQARPVTSSPQRALPERMQLGNQEAQTTPTGKGYQDFCSPTPGYNTLTHSQSFDSASPKMNSSRKTPSLPPRRVNTVKEEPPSSKKQFTSPSPPPVAPRKQSRLQSSADSVVSPGQSSPGLCPKQKPKETTHSLPRRAPLQESETQQGESSEVKTQLGSLEVLVMSLQQTCSSLGDTVQTLKAEVQDLKSQVKQLSTVQSGNSTSTATSTLSSLSREQVLQLLQAMGPSFEKYKVKFTKELIDGELLSHCTEDILENDLGVKNTLDRLKLMQVIQGSKSVESILQGAYVKFEFNGASNST